MAVDYKVIYDKMDWDVVYTASQLGVAAASLTAMSKRGMVEVIDGKPKKYRKVFSPLSKILEAVQGRTSDYFFLHKEDCCGTERCSEKRQNDADDDFCHIAHCFISFQAACSAFPLQSGAHMYFKNRSNSAYYNIILRLREPKCSKCGSI